MQCRLLRLLRMQEVLANLTAPGPRNTFKHFLFFFFSFEERLQSDVVEICVQVLKMVVLLVMLCHFIACFWWAVGTNVGATSWVTASLMHLKPLKSITQHICIYAIIHIYIYVT